MKTKFLASVILIFFYTFLFGQNCGFPSIKIFDKTSENSDLPSVELIVDDGYKILGGGAKINSNENPGSLLTESYPKSLKIWRAEGKAHEVGNEASITAYAIAIYDPTDCWDVIIKTNQSSTSTRAIAQVSLPTTFTMTGGGGRLSNKYPGQLLYGSYPLNNHTWQVMGKDHIKPCAGDAFAYIIGIKPNDNNEYYAYNRIFSETSPSSLIVNQSMNVESPFLLTGGGAMTNWTSVGSLITQTYPKNLNEWYSAAKSHLDPCNATITCMAVGVEFSKDSTKKSSNYNAPAHKEKLTLASIPADTKNEGEAYIVHSKNANGSFNYKALKNIVVTYKCNFFTKTIDKKIGEIFIIDQGCEILSVVSY